MTTEGRLIELFSTEFVSKNNTPFVKVTLVIERPMEYYVRKSDLWLTKKDGKMMFEYLVTDYRKQGQEENLDDFYLYLLDLKKEADKHDIFLVEIDYTINCREVGGKYFQSFRMEKVRGRSGTIDRPVGDNDYVDEPDDELLPF